MTLKPMFANLKEISLTDSSFKKEWTDEDEKKVNHAIKKLFIMKTLTDYRGVKRSLNRWCDIEEFFGLPYTSSSSFAMISNTNTEYFIDTENQFNIEYFALTEDGKVILSAWDRKENEKYFVI